MSEIFEEISKVKSEKSEIQFLVPLSPLSSVVPDITLVTGCFNMSKYHKGARDIKDSIKQTEILTTFPCYIVFFGDETTIPLLKQLREKYHLLHLSYFITIEPEKLWSFQYLDQVKINREKYWPTRDVRTCTETHLITCNKFDFVLQIIELNPFRTSKFGWIDAFLNENAKKICEDFTISKLLYVLNNVTDKFHLQIMNVADKKYKLIENKREYYSKYQWVVCGCLFTCSREIGIKILTRLNEIFVETTKLGYGHGEEMLYLEVLDEFYDDIARGYGDYGQILNNFIEPTKNYSYIVNFILKNYIKHKYYKEAFDCGTYLVKYMESYKIFIDYQLRMEILINYFVAAYYIQPEACKQIHKYILDLCSVDIQMQKVYHNNKNFYDKQLNYVTLLE